MAQDLIRPILEDYLERAQTALTVPVGRVVITPGDLPAWDDCCEGQLYIRVVLDAPFVIPGTRPAAGLQCAITGFIVTLALGVIRCAASVNDNGQAPSAAQVTADGEAMTQDLADLSEAILCSPYSWAIESWQPQGPNGGCHGGEWVFQTRIGTCDCPE